MALSINRKPERKVGSMKADRHLAITPDRARIVERGSQDAGWLWRRKGAQITDAEMKKFGLSVEAGKIVLPEQKAIRDVEDKAIRQVEDKSYPFHIGGGWYELSNGERVQGKEAAEEAEAAQ